MMRYIICQIEGLIIYLHRNYVTNMKKLSLILSMMLVTYSLSAQKKVLVEELTGTWCQYCTSGIYYGDSLVHSHDNVFFVAVHSADAMAYEEYVGMTGLTSAPTANIGRNHKRVGIDNWFGKTTAEMEISPNVTIAVANDYDPTSRLITTTLTANALNNVSGNFRFAAIVVEDGVTGPAPAYNQSNGYSGGSLYMGGYESMPNPVPAERMAYNHVARYMMGGYDGAENSFPSSLNAGQTAQYTFTYTLPENSDPQYTRVIGLLINEQDGKIDNAGISPYLDGNDNAAPLFTSKEKTEAFLYKRYAYNVYFQDPDDVEVTISATTLPDWLQLEQTDNKSAVLSGVPTSLGEYEVVLQLTDGNRTKNQSFTIIVEEALDGGWEYLGQRAFVEGTSNVMDMAIYNDDCYVFVMKDKNPCVFQFGADSTWHQLGSLTGNMAYVGASMAISSVGEVYIAYTDNGANYSYIGHVKKWDGSEWSEVGDVPSAIELSICLDSQDEVYLGCRACDYNYSGYVFKLENGTWNILGGGPYYSDPAWGNTIIDSNDNIYVCGASYPNNNPLAFILDGGNWVALHDDVLANEMVYYYMSLAVNDNNDLFLTFLNQRTMQIDVYQYADEAWTQIGESVSDGSATEYLDVAIKDGYPVLSYISEVNGSYASVKCYDGESWLYIGAATCSEGAASYPAIAVNDDKTYIAFTENDMDKAASVMCYIVNTESINEYTLPDPAFTVYPTVFTDRFIVDSKETGMMRILSVNGFIVGEKRISRGVNEVWLDHVASGVYVLEMEGKGLSVIKK